MSFRRAIIIEAQLGPSCENVEVTLCLDKGGVLTMTVDKQEPLRMVHRDLSNALKELDERNRDSS